jgi:tetratricopeptide (TPR) repeat protein
MASPEESPESRLERQLEQALRAGRSKSFLLPQLERLASIAAEGSRAWCFANRSLAELLIEQAPWRAALHARRVAIATPDDEAAHALLGLALAIQSNYRAAIASYRRALAIDPKNPWYLHNVGHLFDVALDLPREGLSYLQSAHREAPSQDDVAASLAHCLARLDRRDEALELSTELAARRAERSDFAELDQWIRQGNTRHSRPPALLAPHSFEPDAQPSDDADADPARIDRALAVIESAPLDDAQRARALSLLEACRSVPIPSDGDATALGAAIEYAVRRRKKGGPTQQAVADRSATTTAAVRGWFSVLRPLLPA